MKSLGLGVLIGALIGAIAAYFLAPVKEKTVTKEVTVDRVVKDVVTVTKVVERKDGTKVTETTVVDKSKESTKYVAVAQKTVLAPQWLVSAGADMRYSDKQNPIYTLSASKRIIGPVFLGAKVSTDSVGALITVEF